MLDEKGIPYLYREYTREPLTESEIREILRLLGIPARDLLRTKDADNFYLMLNRIVLETGLEVESVAPADDDVNSVYQYLIGEGGTA